MMNRRSALRALAGLGALILTGAVPAIADDFIYTSSFSNAGAGGYDVVAYFTDEKAMEGLTSFQTSYKGADWYFVSQDNLNAFLAAPEKYIPQYGGHCAYAAARGSVAKGDPEQWSVVDGRLFLNYNAGIKAKWLQNRDKDIELADQKWPDIAAKQ